MLNENKAVKTVGIVAVLGVVAAIVGILADSTTFIDWLTGKNEPETSSVTIIETQQETQTQPVPEYNETFLTEPETVPAPTESSTVYLNNLKITESSCFGSSESAEDTVGNTYLGNIFTIGTGFSDDCYAIFYLGGKYCTLTGTIAVSERTEAGYMGQLFLSADDNVIYSTEEMGRASVPVEFSVNVENCQWLKISKIGKGYNMHGNWLILYNWKLEA